MKKYRGSLSQLLKKYCSTPGNDQMISNTIIARDVIKAIDHSLKTIENDKVGTGFSVFSGEHQFFPPKRFNGGVFEKKMDVSSKLPRIRLKVLKFRILSDLLWGKNCCTTCPSFEMLGLFFLSHKLNSGENNFSHRIKFS